MLRGHAPFFESFPPSFWFLVFDYWQNLSNKGKGTYNHPRRKGIAGAPIIRESFRQSLTRYASPASAMLDRLNEYQMEQPAVLRWRIPTSSVSRTYEAILYPPDGRKNVSGLFFNQKNLYLVLIFFHEVVAEILTRVPILIGHQKINWLGWIEVLRNFLQYRS